MVDAVEEDPAIDMNRELALRSWAAEAGLPEDSLHLQHWFGLSKDGDKGALNDALPRPSPWNMFVKESPAVAIVGTGYGLRVWAADAGLGGESRFLSHWFGLADAQTAAEEQLPRPSPWNYFANEKKEYGTPVLQHTLQSWAAQAGLPEKSRFLSHWFGLADVSLGSMDALPRPSPWNHFTRDEAIVDIVDLDWVAHRNRERALRSWAAEAGLPEDSLHLQHWFGLSKGRNCLSVQLPRPSPWNYFTTELTSAPSAVAQKCGFDLRAWSHEQGLAEDSQFLNHWVGLKTTSRTTITDAYGPAHTATPWLYTN